MTDSSVMRVKGRRTTTYEYDDLEHLTVEREEYLEPVDQVEKPGEFDGADLTQSLDHGDAPLEAGDWRIYKVYEKKCIWIRYKEVKKLE